MHGINDHKFAAKTRDTAGVHGQFPGAHDRPSRAGEEVGHETVHFDFGETVLGASYNAVDEDVDERLEDVLECSLSRTISECVDRLEVLWLL